MATFKNTTRVDLEVVVDGTPVHVPAGATFDVVDEHADRVRNQPSFREVKPSGKEKE